MKKQMKTIVLNDLYTMDMQDAERMIDALFKNRSLKDRELKKLNDKVAKQEEDFRNNRLLERQRLNGGYSKGGH